MRFFTLFFPSVPEKYSTRDNIASIGIVNNLKAVDYFYNIGIFQLILSNICSWRAWYFDSYQAYIASRVIFMVAGWPRKEFSYNISFSTHLVYLKGVALICKAHRANCTVEDFKLRRQSKDWWWVDKVIRNIYPLNLSITHTTVSTLRSTVA